MGEGWGGGESFLWDRLVDFAKSLRKRQTEVEKLLWRHLRSKQTHGLKFRRQQPIGSFIADFAPPIKEGIKAELFRFIAMSIFKFSKKFNGKTS